MVIFNKKKLTEENIAEKLRKIRENKQISLKEASLKLNIKQEYLAAIENNSSDRLPGGVYERLFLKKYSAFLGLNSKNVEKEYFAEKLKKTRTTDVFSRKKIEKKHFLEMPKILRNISLLIGFLILASYLIFCLKISFSAPNIKIFFPPDNLVTKEKNIEIYGQTSEKTQISINGKQITKNASGTFKEIVELKIGLNSITISGKNRYGQEKIIERQILVK
jgi:cytoskeletal protein RodZ